MYLIKGVSPICNKALGSMAGRVIVLNVWGDCSFVPGDQVHLDGIAGDLKTNGGGVPVLGLRQASLTCPFMTPTQYCGHVCPSNAPPDR